MQEAGPPKSVTVEDSFRSCHGFAAAEKVGTGGGRVYLLCAKCMQISGPQANQPAA